MGRKNPLWCALGLLTAANVLNNRVARRWAPLTSSVTTAALVALARREGLSFGELGFGCWSRGARVGGTLAAGVAVGYAAGVGLRGTRPLFRDERSLALSRARLAEEILLQVPVGTVLLEEVAFRGVLPALLASHGFAGRSFSPRAAAVASAVLFGLWHALPAMDMARANPALSRVAAAGTGTEARTPEGGAPTSPSEAVPLVAGTVLATGIAGLLFHELRRRGGLLAPSLVHLATNALGYVAARLARGIDAAPVD